MEIPEEIESYRDKKWRREETRKVSKSADLEDLVEDLGFCWALTDSRVSLPSVYIAVCGRRDVHAPKNVQKDEEMSLAWVLKDEVMQRGNVYYSKLVKGKAMFVARRLIPYFNAIHGVPKALEKVTLTLDAQTILDTLREEWESSTGDLKDETNIHDRKRLTKALDELQRSLKVIPYEVLYKPKFTYLWTLAEARFMEELSKNVSRETAIKELAKVFLEMCGMTFRGDLARAIGVPAKQAGYANHQLVDEGFAERIKEGVYRLSSIR
ncbi:MAG: hypothetical protein HKN25_12780 [Pyrinomonadaceae bacterium]|nr:hypothetical protein [Pyrinomonadaceae bacterium]